MAIITENVIHLGNFADMDTTEDSGGSVEDTSPIDGVTYGSAAKPLVYNNLVSASFNDANNDNYLDTDHATYGTSAGVGETVSYDLGTGMVSSQLDMVGTVSGTVNYRDGSSLTIDEAYVFQLQNGDLFIYNSNWSGSTDLNQGAVPIESLELDYENIKWDAIWAPEIEGITCFLKGTLIETNNGEIAIEDLSVGDLVRTLDDGFQPIRWIGSKKVPAKGKIAPILFRKGTLENHSDLYVSPQHRMLLKGPQCELLFGQIDVLATAKSMINGSSICQVEGGEVEYFHMLFDTHEIVFAEGALSESFHPGAEAMNTLGAETRAELFSLFPELENDIASYGPSARYSLKAYEGRLLVSEMGLAA